MKKNIDNKPKTANEWLEYWEKIHDDEFRTMFPNATLTRASKK